MNRFFLCIIVLVSGLSACQKLETTDTSLEESIREEKAITDYLTANSLVATRYIGGMYYIISSPGGTDNLQYFLGTTVTAKYTGRILNGATFATVTAPTPNLLGSLILGWQYGVPLIQKGGKVRLFVPSAMAYGQYGVQNSTPPIPANSVLDFDIELVDAHN